VEDELCPAFRQVYHLCYWCSPLAATGDYMYTAEICDLDRPWDDETINVDAACQEIRRVFLERNELPSTIELIELQRKVGHLCVDTCNNADPSKACFSSENPPSCDDGKSKAVAIEYDAQTTCSTLEWWYVWPNDLATHGGALAGIHADSEFCRAVGAFYYQCFWCVTTHEDYNQTIELPLFGADYCKIDCFNVPQQVDPDDKLINVADMNATCEGFSRILEQKHFPATIDTCESYRRMGHLCPQLECGKYNYDASNSCFTDQKNIPTCEANIFVANENNDDVVLSPDYVQNTCYTLATEYLLNTDIIWNVSLHAKALSMIHSDSDLCHAVKRVYHLCHWCSPDAVVSHCSMPNCFTLEPSLDIVVDSSINVTSACQELTHVFQNEQSPSTIKCLIFVQPCVEITIINRKMDALQQKILHPAWLLSKTTTTTILCY